MSKNLGKFNLGATNLGKVNIGSAESLRPNIAASQLIDLTEKTKTAQVVREGFEVPRVALDPRKTTFEIDNMITVLPRSMPRVVSQSIPAGTKVPPGTVIDFVVVPKTDIPFTIFQAVHESLATKNLDHVDSLVENATVRQVLLKNESAADLTPAEKEVLVTEFKNKGIAIDETQPGKTFEKAFNSVRGAVAFR
jgi:hypothetical protein